MLSGPLEAPVPAQRSLAPWATLLILIALMAPVAGAQVFIDTDQRSMELTPGESTSTTFQITNPTDRSYVVQAAPAGNLSEATEVTPSRFDVTPQNETRIDVTITPPDDSDFREGDLNLRFQFIDRETGETLERTEHIPLTMTPTLLYLGAFENPLPEPYDAWGWLFALEIATWALTSLAVAAIMRTATNTIVPRATDETQASMAGKMRWPLAALPVVLGLNASWRLLPREPVVHVTGTLLDALSIVIVALAAYRTLSAGLVYYGEYTTQAKGRNESVLVPVLEKLSAATVVALAGFYVLQALGVEMSFLVGGGLVAGLVISMAAQDTLSNFFSGLHLLLDQPFREGDVLELDTGEICRVEHIGLRSTRLYHFLNHQEIIAPNNELATNRVINMSYPDTLYRVAVPVGVSYDTDLEEATSLLYTLAMETDEVIKGRKTKPGVFVREFGDSSINLEVRVYVPNERDRHTVRTKLIKRVHALFDEEDITIPFPQRVLHVQASQDAPLPELRPPDSMEGEDPSQTRGDPAT